MAKKGKTKATESEKVKAFQFVFDPAGLQSILDMGPKKVLFTVSIETEVTKDGRKVGALKIDATGVGSKALKAKKLGDDPVVDGCPVPPCHTTGG